MSNRGILGALAVCLYLGLAGASILGWIYLSRDRAAVTTYRLLPPDGARFEQVVEKEAEIYRSDAVLKPVIEDLELRDRWNLESDQEALVRLRSKLTIKPATHADYVKVVFKDRSQKRALEILDAINREFGAARYQAAEQGKVPPIVPVEVPAETGVR